MDKFVFYSKSADKKPGYGVHERASTEYTKLSDVRDWRKMLSNFWECRFELDGYMWNSVEQYYQASKYKNQPHHFKKILECGSALEAKKLGGKRYPCDSDFFSSGRCHLEMERAQRCKFTQNPYLYEVLKNTGDAELWHYMRGGKLIRFVHLEDIRKDSD